MRILLGIFGLQLILVCLGIPFCNAQSARSIKKMLLSEPDFDIEVLTCDRPWEQRLDYASVIEVNDRYIMYYRSVQYQSEPWMVMCYAISDDGIDWVKPDLEVFSFNGDTHNNIISDRFNGVGVLYKDSVYYWIVDRIYDENNQQNRLLRLLESSDGFHFKEIGGFNVPFFCDSQNQVIWDEHAQKYRWYLRSWYYSNENIKFNHSNLLRSVSYLESDSLTISIKPSQKPLMITGKNEPPSIDSEIMRIMFNQGDEDYDIYNPCVHQYRDNLYIAYPTSYYHYPSVKNGGSKDNDGKGIISFWVSNDGKNFTEEKHRYIENDNNWLEYCIGHIENDKYIIHYYIPFSNSHAGKQRKNAVRARIHIK